MQGSASKSFPRTLLKEKSWQLNLNNSKNLKFLIQLIEDAPNFKHQKLTLLIQIINEVQETRFFKTFKTSDLPSQAITIFSDVETVYDYIDESFDDQSRIKFDSNNQVFTIVNIVVMKNKELKQEIDLTLDRQRYIVKNVIQQDQDRQNMSFLNSSQISAISSKELLEESRGMMESMLKDTSAALQSKISMMSEHLNNFISEIRILKNENKTISSAFNSCNIAMVKLQKQNAALTERVALLERQKANISDIPKPQPTKGGQISRQQFQQIKKQIIDNKWNIEQLTISYQNLRQEYSQLKKTKVEQQKPKSDHMLPLFNEMRKDVFVLSNQFLALKQNLSKLGTKVFVNLDVNSKYIDNFRIIENIVEKISGDEQRHQILGKEGYMINELKNKIFFEIKIISTVSAGVVIGIVGDNRRADRYSYDKKECLCYDGKGFIFEQGQKMKMPTQFHNGQVLRVVIDPQEAWIHWFVGYTQIGSTLIPESMRKIKIVPYFQLYDISDKVAING